MLLKRLEGLRGKAYLHEGLDGVAQASAFNNRSGRPVAKRMTHARARSRSNGHSETVYANTAALVQFLSLLFSSEAH